MDKTSTVLEELHSTIECIERGIVSISFIPQHRSNGNSWAIRGPKQKLIVILHYQNEFKLANGFDDEISIKQEPVENVMLDSRMRTIDSEAVKLHESKQHVTNLKQKTLILVEDLRKIVDYITKGIVIFSFHPQHQCEGNVWAVRGPKQNCVILLFYENESEILNVEGVITIKQEPKENFMMDCQSKGTGLGVKFIDISAVETNEAESILPDVADSTCHCVKHSFNSIIENVMDDFRRSQCYKVHSTHESNSDGIYRNLTCAPSYNVIDGDEPSITEGTMKSLNQHYHSSETISIKQERDNEMMDFQSIVTDSDCANTSVIVKEENELNLVHESLTSFEGTVSTRFQTHGMDFMDPSVFSEMEMIELKNCSVLLEPLDMASLKKDCSVGTQQQERLQNKIRKQIKVGDATSVRCSQCGNGFRMKEVNVESYQCSDCVKLASSMSDLNHVAKVHPQQGNYFCSECGATFLDSDSFNVHVQEYHVSYNEVKCLEQVQDDEKSFQCLVCDKKFSSECVLREHKLIHTGETPYKCFHCGKRFAQKNLLNQHKVVHTGEKPYMCVQCGKTFARKYSLNQHKLLHTGEKPYECSECGIKFSQRSTLIRHSLAHSGEKPYECSVCGKIFPWSSTLDRHKLIHNGDTSHTTSANVCKRIR